MPGGSSFYQFDYVRLTIQVTQRGFFKGSVGGSNQCHKSYVVMLRGPSIYDTTILHTFFPSLIAISKGWASELKKVLTFRVATLPDYRRVALQTFRIAIGLLSYFKTFRVALLPRYPGFCDSGLWLKYVLGLLMQQNNICFLC